LPQNSVGTQESSITIILGEPSGILRIPKDWENCRLGIAVVAQLRKEPLRLGMKRKRHFYGKINFVLRFYLAWISVSHVTSTSTESRVSPITLPYFPMYLVNLTWHAQIYWSCATPNFVLLSYRSCKSHMTCTNLLVLCDT